MQTQFNFTKVLIIASIAILPTFNKAAAATVLVEAENFEEYGGWKLDTQFIEIMGSPYLIAHGLGKPVQDAITTVRFPKAGNYRVFVRTKDWVARWNAPGTPGRFQLLINGKPLDEMFGTKGADWFWHYGGEVKITNKTATIALHDLSGFDGRCDAIIFTDEPNYTPPNDATPNADWRLKLAGKKIQPADAGHFDFVVVGGGYAGMCAAISAARMGCKVALIQDRPVLGGNGSSEIRVWPQGGTRRGLFPRLGEIVEELVDRPKQSPGSDQEFNDERREAIVRAEKNISLFLNHYAYKVETNQNGRITAVVAFDTRTGERKRFRAEYFADCTGHGRIGYLAGADHTTQERGHMGMSNMWRWRNADSPREFPLTPWALPLTMKDFPYPSKFAGEWFWESGFDKDPIRDLEYVRDWNLRAVFGAFNAMKNGDGKEKHRNAELEWVAYIGGTRESRQLLGDIILTRDDIVERKIYPDACVPTTWDIDLHYPDEKYLREHINEPFISRAVFDRAVDKANGYPIPYRCFYSRNINNLFMAGRCISVNREALGTVRVQKTGGMMGEVVGKAVSLCVKYKRTPREIYDSHLEELKELMRLPGLARRETVNSKIIIPPNVPEIPPPSEFSIPVSSLPGIVIDDMQAKLIGAWGSGNSLPNYVGQGYRYIAPTTKGAAQYDFIIKDPGFYEARMSYQQHTNRCSKTRVIINCADGAITKFVNQREKPPIPPSFLSLGTFEFEANSTNTILIDNTNADGFVNIDAIQILKK
ncbi:MAG: FAD-dependent oxidoreductase [Verrucomicrobiia bacterium]